VSPLELPSVQAELMATQSATGSSWDVSELIENRAKNRVHDELLAHFPLQSRVDLAEFFFATVVSRSDE